MGLLAHSHNIWQGGRGGRDSCLLSSPFRSKSAGDGGGGGEVERLKSRIRKAGDHARVSTECHNPILHTSLLTVSVHPQ